MSLFSMQLVTKKKKKTRYLESGFAHVYRSDGKKIAETYAQRDENHNFYAT